MTRHLPEPLSPLDWLNHLPERGREFERRAEEWREAEERYIHLRTQAEAAHDALQRRSADAEAAAGLYWLASEISAAKACYESERKGLTCACGLFQGEQP